MATNPAHEPQRNPIDEEIAEVYAAHPELKAELDEMERQLEAGELATIDHDEVRRRLRQLVGEEL